LSIPQAGLCYFDGANLNAFLGRARPGDMGADIFHFNLHKTFSTPHGGGGPGAGPLAVSEPLIPYLPVPEIVKEGEKFRLNFDKPKSIGRVHPYFGNFLVMVKALAYILTLGDAGMAEVSAAAVLAANYLRVRLKGTYKLPLRSAVQARIRPFRGGPCGGDPHARYCQAPHRLWIPSAHDLFPPHRPGGPHD
jgi:glycine dehydrogenase subunit 2